MAEVIAKWTFGIIGWLPLTPFFFKRVLQVAMETLYR